MTIRGFKVFMVGALAAAASAIIAAPAFAQGGGSMRPTDDPHVMVSPDGRLSTQVQYEDTDLASNSGAHKVYRQLQSAAETVCGDNGSFVHDLSIRRDMDQCENSAIEDAVARINNPRLTAVYDQNVPPDAAG